MVNNLKDYVKEKKYSIIDKKTKMYLDNVKKSSIQGLCFNKFKADFVFDGNIKYLNVGDTIYINGIKMIITKIGKGCYPMDCDFFKKNSKFCELKNGIAFAK